MKKHLQTFRLLKCPLNYARSFWMLMGWLSLTTTVMATTVTFEVPGQANLYQQTNPETVLGSIDPVKVPNIRLKPGQSIEVTATGCAVSNGSVCVTPDGYPELFRGLPVYSLIGRWSHSPDTLDNSTVASDPFYVGSFSILTVPSEPGDYYLFLGENDGGFSDNAGSFTVTAKSTLTVTNITPKTVRFGDEVALFNVKGTNLVPNMIFSLRDCDQIQEVGTGTATDRFFQCTPKNNEGTQPGTVSLQNGKVIKKFSVEVKTTIKPQVVNAKLEFFKGSLLPPNQLSGYFPIGGINGLTDVPSTLSSATPWYIKVNGKKVYSGSLGDSFRFKRKFSSKERSTGSTLIYLKANAGKLFFKWDNAILSYQLSGKLPELLSQIPADNTQKTTFEFGLGATKAIFTTIPDGSYYAATKASWTHNISVRDDAFYLTADKIALRQTLLDNYVRGDVKSNVDFLNALNLGTIASNEMATGLADSLDNTLSILKLSSYMGKEVTKEVKVELLKQATSYTLSESLGYLTESQSRAASKFLEDFTKLAVENAVDFSSGDFTGVVTSFAFYSYETVINAFSAFLLNDRLEKIYEYRIAEEVTKQLIAHDGNIGKLHSSLFPDASANSKSWRKVIIGVASKMECRANTPCSIGGVLSEKDYDPEVVNGLVQNYLAMIRTLSGYGNLYMHVAQ